MEGATKLKNIRIWDGDNKEYGISNTRILYSVIKLLNC